MSNKKIMLIISITLFGVMDMVSCTHSSQGNMQVSFSKDIIPILSSSCAISGSCHVGATSLNLQTNFDSDSAYYTIMHKNLVSTSNPASSLLYAEVAEGQMPLAPYAPLPASQQALILDWITQGALNN